MKTNNITYRQVGDYIIPNLTLTPEETNIRIGRWGQMHRDYLKEHKPVVFATLLAQGKLWQYLANIDTQAREMFDTLVEQMKDRERVTEQSKEENQMLWVQTMSNIQNKANAIVCKDLIFK